MTTPHVTIVTSSPRDNRDNPSRDNRDNPLWFRNVSIARKLFSTETTELSVVLLINVFEYCDVVTIGSLCCVNKFINDVSGLKHVADMISLYNYLYPVHFLDLPMTDEDYLAINITDDDDDYSPSDDDDYSPSDLDNKRRDEMERLWWQ
jgi:hypothetical protein